MVIRRRTVRAILLTPEREVLLLRIRNPNGARFWITPGGAFEGDESPELALRRELQEEVGLETFEMGPLVWTMEHGFAWGAKQFHQHEQFHLIRVARFEPHMSDAFEREALDVFRWWPVAELTSATDPVSPEELPEIIARHGE